MLNKFEGSVSILFSCRSKTFQELLQHINPVEIITAGTTAAKYTIPVLPTLDALKINAGEQDMISEIM